MDRRIKKSHTPSYKPTTNPTPQGSHLISLLSSQLLHILCQDKSTRISKNAPVCLGYQRLNDTQYFGIAASLDLPRSSSKGDQIHALREKVWAREDLSAGRKAP